MKKYDIVIYGATVRGIVAAIENKLQGKDVLLLNYYGFPGGSITESLNCLQEMPGNQCSGIIRNILEKYRSENCSSLYEYEELSLLNPEILKYTLQSELSEHGIEVLYHVQPMKTHYYDNCFYLQLLGKEGIIEVVSEHLTDASADHRLLISAGYAQPEPVCQRHNIFLSAGTSEMPALQEDYQGLSRLCTLSDGRIWLSYDVIETDPLLVEKRSQEIFTFVSDRLSGSGRRIQIVPAQPHILYSYPETNDPCHIGASPDIAVLIGSGYDAEKEFLT
ncbi:MAG: FAD-dependent oxidoreductase [Bacteroidota bacterium]